MDVLEVEINQNRVVAFDGRVLELFGGEVHRFHVKLLGVSVRGPDKRGNRYVTLTQFQRSVEMPFDEAAFAQFQPVLDALRTAGVTVNG